MIKLLGRASSSNVQKVAWALAEMDVACERVDIGGSFGGNKEADYLKLNPNGAVPTLIDGDTVVWESNTILRYLSNRFNRAVMYPSSDDAAGRSQVECWMDWQLASLSPGITSLFISIIRTPIEQRDPLAIERHRQVTLTSLRVLDGALAQQSDGGPFLLGEALTLADFAIGPHVHRWFALPIERESLPALERWHGEVIRRAAFVQHVMVGMT